MLVFYLYPRRFDLSDRKQNRILSDSDAPRAGLLGQVLRSISHIPVIADSFSRLHKFVVPAGQVDEGEIDEMQLTHDLYSGPSA